MAKELLDVHAAREAHGRPAYGAADGLYREFVARFPFEVTPDQQRAIDDVLADLAREKPMDRLVCGDVGFGKTEVAMRAAFLAVLEGKQVAVLVPTTVLAQQHLETFVARFAGYPVRVGVLSRFQSPVENIDAVARRLGELVPETAIAVAHGQMEEGALERTMLAFMHGQSKVLVTSAIIESGLDIPNANTIIINRADTFGLAQLYQLRGRVGRSHHRAYAYLLIPREHLITAAAQKRLRVLQELDDLGGGFRLAAHDLEIRGGGNLLGKQPSGHITAVGLELYTTMMEQAVRELRCEPAEAEVEPEIQLGIPAFIPDRYIPDVSKRLVFYKRLAAIRGVPDLDEITAELVDRYGPVPPLVDTLMRLMELRRWLKDLRIVAARRRGERIVLEFAAATPVRTDTLLETVRRSRGSLRLLDGSTLAIAPEATDHDGTIAEVRALLQRLSAA